ncbi:hypothetical protein KKF34_07625 [Myxococcota bacterium]|nr:hypothetical protein [Myxococcota bacterium]MBU1381157.1 hypothetical protein [Myxococcota bacterium]MBU1496729.1 hypothetical protein [Myxococcota bacterium]
MREFLCPGNIDRDAFFIVKKLQNAGFSAFIVGGSVRDLLINRTPKDFDIATNATPREIRRIFRNSRVIGRRFKLVHVFFNNNKIIETSTFRSNPQQIDSDDLLITSDNNFGTAQEDALRRDFTVNGLFYDPVSDKIIDYVDGLKDIDLRSIRTIGNPDIRFQEDPVRIIRAIRFAGKLDFRIEDETWYNMVHHREKILESSPRRVLDEIWKTILSGYATDIFPLFIQSGMMKVVLPEIDEWMATEPGYSIMKETFGLIDTAINHPLLQPGISALLIFQGTYQELFEERYFKGNIVTSVFRNNLNTMLEKYGFSRKIRDEIHQILQIFAQIGHPGLERKILPRTRGRQLFPQAEFFWNLVWKSRGFSIQILDNKLDVKNSGKVSSRRRHAKKNDRR